MLHFKHIFPLWFYSRLFFGLIRILKRVLMMQFPELYHCWSTSLSSAAESQSNLPWVFFDFLSFEAGGSPSLGIYYRNWRTRNLSSLLKAIFTERLIHRRTFYRSRLDFNLAFQFDNRRYLLYISSCCVRMKEA